MHITVFMFLAWALVGIAFLAAVLENEFNVRSMRLRQVGDSSLGRHSVDWMAAIAVTAAVMICFVLN